MIPMDMAGFIRSAATLAGQAFSAAQAAGSAIAPRAQAMLPPGRATSARTGCQRKEGTTLFKLTVMFFPQRIKTVLTISKSHTSEFTLITHNFTFLKLNKGRKSVRNFNQLQNKLR